MAKSVGIEYGRVARANAPAGCVTWQLPAPIADTTRGCTRRRRPRGVFFRPDPGTPLSCGACRTITDDKAIVTITLSDGGARQLDNPDSVMDVAQSIGAGLAKAAIAGVSDKSGASGSRQGLSREMGAHSG